jgi:flavin-dependent dehydrogenase
MKIAIVGCGPCGLSASLGLSQNGINHTLIAESVGKKLCGGGLSDKLLQNYPQINSKKVMEKISGRSIKKMRWFLGSKSIELDFDHAVCDRMKLDQFLFGKVQDKGTEVIRTRVKKVLLGEKIKLNCSKGKMKTEILYDASGCLGPLNGAPFQQKNRAFALEDKFEMDSDKVLEKTNGELKLYFEKHKGLFGYFWIFPGLDFVHVGGGYFSTDSHKRNINKKMISLLDSFEKRYGFSHLKKKYRKGAFLSQPAPPSKLNGKNYAIGGDAANLVSIFGEGNYYAISSGEVFSQIISQEKSLDEYSTRLLPVQKYLYNQFKILPWIINTPLDYVFFNIVPLIGLKRAFAAWVDKIVLEETGKLKI